MDNLTATHRGHHPTATYDPALLVDVRKLALLAKTKGPQARAAVEVARTALRGRYLNAPGLGWLRWDGRRWAEGPTVAEQVADDVRAFVDEVQTKWAVEHRLHQDAADEFAKQLSGQEVTDEQQKQLDTAVELAESAKAQAAVWLNLMSNPDIKALTSLAGRMEGILTDHTTLDAWPDLLNVGNGVVDLRTGQLQPHDPTLLMTKLARGDYVPGATCPRWDAARKAIHPEIREWMQTRLGQSATGHRPDDDVLFVCWGDGANGKSTVLNAVKAALGDYAGLVPHRALMASADAHTTELTTFRGLRLALMEETAEEGRLDMHRVKTTVGTPTITARKIRQDDIEFATTHTMWINTNHKPQVSGADHGTWRRLLAVPWPYTFVAPGSPKHSAQHVDGDTKLRPDVVDEPSPQTSSAIISWLVEGAHRWYAADRVSPPHPEAVLTTSAAWRVESDVALLFIQDNLVAEENAFIASADMREAFVEFLKEQGRPVWSAQTMTTRLTESLPAAGMARAEATQVRVKPGDEQSFPAGSFRTERLAVGSKARLWRGVRFRTQADDRLRAVPDL